MKELNDHKPEKVKIEKQAQVAKSVIVQRFFLRPGQRVWEFDIKSQTIVQAEYKSSDLDTAGVIRHKIDIKENCLYTVAINAKVADKKFMKLLGIKLPKGAKTRKL